MIAMGITKTCSLVDCDRPHKGRGYCRTHLDRFRATGDPGPVQVRVYRVETCTQDGCDDEHVAQGLCGRHYARLRKHGDPARFTPRVGEHAPNWQGDAITYAAAHYRVKAARGRAANHACTCGAQACDWAYDYADPNVQYGDNGDRELRPYSTDPAHYSPMCRPCHRAMDLAHAKERRQRA